MNALENEIMRIIITLKPNNDSPAKAGPTGRLNQWVFVDTYKLTNVCMIIDNE